MLSSVSGLTVISGCCFFTTCLNLFAGMSVSLMSTIIYWRQLYTWIHSVLMYTTAVNHGHTAVATRWFLKYKLVSPDNHFHRILRRKKSEFWFKPRVCKNILSSTWIASLWLTEPWCVPGETASVDMHKCVESDDGAFVLSQDVWRCWCWRESSILTTGLAWRS